MVTIDLTQFKDLASCDKEKIMDGVKYELELKLNEAATLNQKIQNSLYESDTNVKDLNSVFERLNSLNKEIESLENLLKRIEIIVNGKGDKDFDDEDKIAKTTLRAGIVNIRPNDKYFTEKSPELTYEHVKKVQEQKKDNEFFEKYFKFIQDHKTNNKS